MTQCQNMLNKELTFQPNIHPKSKVLPKRSIEELHKADAVRLERKLKDLRRRQNEMESQELTFKPEINKGGPPQLSGVWHPWKCWLLGLVSRAWLLLDRD